MLPIVSSAYSTPEDARPARAAPSAGPAAPAARHEPTIDAAVARLKAERAIDDGRVAEAIARTEVTIKRRGRLRVERQIESAGIAPATARRAVDEVYGELDDEALLEAALDKRLRGRERRTSSRRSYRPRFQADCYRRT